MRFSSIGSPEKTAVPIAEFKVQIILYSIKKKSIRIMNVQNYLFFPMSVSENVTNILDLSQHTVKSDYELFLSQQSWRRYQA